MRVGIVAGEASGDILGAGLMKALQQRYPGARFEGIGGPRMCALGFHSFFPMDRLSVMGLVEPLKRLPELLRIRRFLFNHFADNPPDVFIGIDSPDFNLTLEKRLHHRGIKTVHYVSPSVWAWRQKRIFKIKQSVDLMLTLLPFEAAFYRQHDVPVCFVGHPLADDIALEVDRQQARDGLNLDLQPEDTVVALLPGSRGGEVKMLGEVFLRAAALIQQQCAGVKFVIPAANEQRRAQLQRQVADLAGQLPGNLSVIQGRSHEVMAAADAVLMASGTTTLEALLLKKPMVVAYKMAPLSYAILSRLVKSKYISLPNLLADRQLVPEILQNDATPQALADAVVERLQPEVAQQLQDEFLTIHQQLRRNASDTAAQAILDLVAAS